MNNKKSFAIIVDNIPEDEWGNVLTAFKKNSFIVLPDTIAIHWNQLSLAEQLFTTDGLAKLTAVYVKKLYDKQSGGN